MGAPLRIQFPDKLGILFQPSRYKVLRGGRGSSKSWSVARRLLLKGVESPLRVLCAREIQKSIKDSVHRLLEDQIDELGLRHLYDVQKTVIYGPNGTEFNFAGLRFNIADLKSFEGADICWIEEAQTVSKESWKVLIPTIRKPGSEIWLTFNPDLETDETFKRFVKNPPPDCLSVEINWRDNPWFPDVLRVEMETLKERDFDEYLHVWEGKCRQALEGAIYAEELRAATAANRIGKVPFDPTKPVFCYWDLGFADFTSIWFAQWVGMELRVIDFYQNQLKKLAHYAKVLRDKPYTYGTLYLPHDAKAQRLGADNTILQQLEDLGFEVEIVPDIGLKDGINAGRTLFSHAWIDEDNCADGLNALRRYRYEFDQETGQYSAKPKHDDASHAADAWRYMGVAMKKPEGKKKPMNTMPKASGHKYGWMSS